MSKIKFAPCPCQHSSRCEIVSYFGFNLHFSVDELCGAHFHVLIGHSHILSGEVHFEHV